MADLLLKELKDKLRITWDDDKNLLEKIENAKSYFSVLTNAKFDYENEKWPKDLLLDRCRYDYHNSLDEFEKNYAKELRRLIAMVAIGRVGVPIE